MEPDPVDGQSVYSDEASGRNILEELMEATGSANALMVDTEAIINRQGYNVTSVRRAHLEYTLAYNTGTNGRGSKHGVSISDDGADTIIIGNHGWKILVVCNCAVNLVGYDSKSTRKPNCPIVCAACVAKQADGSKVLVVAFEGVLNKGSSTSLISEFQVREAGNIIDSVSKRHTGVDGNPGTQCMKLKGDDDDMVTIPFITRSGLMTFEHWEPTDDELHDLPRVYLSEKAPWNPSKYYDDHDTIPPMLSPEDIAVMATTTGEVPLSEPSSDPTAGESNDPAPLSEEPDLLFFDAIQPEEPELPFIDASAGEDEYYYDPSDLITPAACHSRAFHLTIDYDAFYVNK